MKQTNSSLILLAAVCLLGCVCSSQTLHKRPSWLHGRSIAEQEPMTELEKRPSWLIGRSVEDSTDDDLLKGNSNLITGIISSLKFN